MTRLAEIEGRIASMDELLDIVGAMRSLAGMRLQEAQHALPGIRRYVESMAAAIGAALLLMSKGLPETQPDGWRRALILCTAEHGFVGGFNERLIEAAESTLKAQDALFVLGSRGAALMFERGWQARWTRPMATRLAGAPDTVNRLASELYACIAGSEISRIEVIFGRYRQGSPPTIERYLLLPLELASLSATPPQQAPLQRGATCALRKAHGRICVRNLNGGRSRINCERECGTLCGDGVRARQRIKETLPVASGCPAGAAI
jgi:F-type H+-transporting ATPase subunit gamma